MSAGKEESNKGGENVEAKPIEGENVDAMSSEGEKAHSSPSVLTPIATTPTRSSNAPTNVEEDGSNPPSNEEEQEEEMIGTQLETSKSAEEEEENMEAEEEQKYPASRDGAGTLTSMFRVEQRKNDTTELFKMDVSSLDNAIKSQLKAQVSCKHESNVESHVESNRMPKRRLVFHRLRGSEHSTRPDPTKRGRPFTSQRW